MLSSEEREIIKQVGRYKFNKMRMLGLTIEQLKAYEQKERNERLIKKHMGHHQYTEMKKLNMTPLQYKEYKKEKKLENSAKYREKTRLDIRR